MITFPNAKINLGLNIIEKRPDGYHNLETIFYPINLQDDQHRNGEREYRKQIINSQDSDRYTTQVTLLIPPRQ